MNTHFHLGGEHQNVGAGGYSLNYTEALSSPSDIVPNDIRPGYFCAPVNQTPEAGDNWTLDDYHWTSCKNVKMGYTYEFHWVHSTGGPIDGVLSNGLGGVFNRTANPTAFVRGQICRIVNWPEQGVHWLHHRYPLRQLQMFSSRSDMARGSRVLHSVGTEHGPYVLGLVGVWHKYGG